MTSTPTEEFVYELRIPKERVAVLIGKKGEVKRAIEHSTKTKIEVNSEEGEVSISGKDAFLLYLAREIIRAISRGFNPDLAQLLLKQDYGFELVSISDFTTTPKEFERLRGRVIGEGGKSRRTIEELTETRLSIFGKTVGIIGPIEYLVDARRAVESLLSGSPHAHVYRWLERRRKQRRLKAMTERI